MIFFQFVKIIILVFNGTLSEESKLYITIIKSFCKNIGYDYITEKNKWEDFVKLKPKFNHSIGTN
ncbi:hypothetical protein SAMN05443144_14610 [Fodinibius roseus]|uniref:Uncharacterized protein n=1 Tax=Fodinibius roseus TaxID=1194090 RepID=A0A1M5LWX1_9BACT|nr:hypothetical protein SAMN05443144_14610 [Fodinibius roseus]